MDTLQWLLVVGAVGFFILFNTRAESLTHIGRAGLFPVVSLWTGIAFASLSLWSLTIFSIMSIAKL